MHALALLCLALPVLDAMSSRIVGGIEAEGGGDNTDVLAARARSRAKGLENARAGGGGGGGSGGGGGGAGDGGGQTSSPNVLVVVLESTSGTFVTPTNAAGVSPWAKELASR